MPIAFNHLFIFKRKDEQVYGMPTLHSCMMMRQKTRVITPPTAVKRQTIMPCTRASYTGSLAPKEEELELSPLTPL